MKNWKITSAAGVDLGVWKAETLEGALDALARDQGYASMDDAEERVDGWGQGMEIEAIDTDEVST